MILRNGGKRRAFTLVELMVVVAMIAVIVAAMTTSIAGAKNRTKIQKAISEVKVISQAILAYENFNLGNEKFELPLLNDREADRSSIGFLIGEGESAQSGAIPALLLASLSSGGKMMDPWGRPYLVNIKKSTGRVKIQSANTNLRTGFIVPNQYHLTEEERK